ncbi:MAG TPA: FGGY family carbohydrate kinase [Atribacterota bacterium]|nr:FGGY family carbohydrate kinase [Atribacterota bacterium]
MNILILEVSSSSAKAMIYSKEGMKHFHNINYNKGISDLVTQDAEGIYHCLLKSAETVLKKCDYSIDIISLSSTWHSLLFLDQARKPVGKIMTWANSESAGTSRKYRQTGELQKRFYQKTGCVIHSMYPLWKWIYLKEKGLVNNNNYFSSQGEYIFERLTGEIGISQSMASGTGMMNIHNLDWDQDILKFAEIDRKQLAPLRKPFYNAPLLKEEADKLGLPSGIPVIIAGPDGAFNQIGSGALGSDVMTVSVGTSGALRMASDHPVLPDDPSTWCYYVAEGKRLAGAATSGAGNCLKWFKDQVQHNLVDYQSLDQLSQKINPKEAPIFLPFLYGERCPGWQDESSGCYFDLRGNQGTGHLHYAIMEGVLFNLYQNYKILSKVGDLPKEIHISGGIINSSFWLQMAADIFQREMSTSHLKHASLMGAAVTSLKVLGVIGNLQQYETDLGKIIKPRKDQAELYQSRYSRYVDCYHNSSKW